MKVVATTQRARQVRSLVAGFAALLHALLWGASARAQETDGRFLFGGGIVPISISHATFEVADSQPDESVTTVRADLGGDVLLAVGFGLSSWVLAIETALAHSVDTSSRVDVTSSASQDQDSSYTDVRFGPSARYLFNEGSARWFLEAGAGFGLGASSTSYSEGTSTTLYARGGPGVQIRLADPVSLDLALRVGYATTAGEVEVTVSSIAPLDRISRSDRVTALADYSIAETAFDVVARLSIWL